MTDEWQASLSTTYKPMRITSMDEREAVMDFRYAKIAPSAMIAAHMRRASWRERRLRQTPIPKASCASPPTRTRKSPRWAGRAPS
jgi:hypothetical protein